MHSWLCQWAHSIPQADKLLLSVHVPATGYTVVQEGLAFPEISSVEQDGVVAGSYALLPAVAMVVGAGQPICPTDHSPFM